MGPAAPMVVAAPWGWGGGLIRAPKPSQVAVISTRIHFGSLKMLRSGGAFTTAQPGACCILRQGWDILFLNKASIISVWLCLYPAPHRILTAACETCKQIQSSAVMLFEKVLCFNKSLFSPPAKFTWIRLQSTLCKMSDLHWLWFALSSFLYSSKVPSFCIML